MIVFFYQYQNLIEVPFYSIFVLSLSLLLTVTLYKQTRKKMRERKAYSRRQFVKISSLAITAFSLPTNFTNFLNHDSMEKYKHYDVIIIGGSYSGLAAGMALGRALKTVLIIDSNKPCNRQTPHSHNFLTQDGKKPSEISNIAKTQVLKYGSVSFHSGIVEKGTKLHKSFKIELESKEIFTSDKLIFASGIKDILPNIDGFSECWGISVLHCPYCHGYEVKNQQTGILGNGEYAFEFGKLISNWTNDLTIFTNGASTLTPEQTSKLQNRNIKIVETEIESIEHEKGYVENIVFKNGEKAMVKAIYTRTPFEQNSKIPSELGCEITDEGYLKTDATMKTSVDGVYACGDLISKIRTVANAVSTGTTAGMMVNKEMIFERF
ncbi:NAD(P)/FAD-dependent oxidoreductase [Flavobacterium cauense]|nr:NAD(P)/FAD-dependent oxidoreductase [Flavobacterium cauense]